MSEPLQFERAEMSQPAASACAVCQAPLGDHYFQAVGKVLCGACAERFRSLSNGRGTPAGRFFKAAFMGLGVAVAGSLIYYAIVKTSGIQLSLITVLIGHYIGKVVRAGSGGRGGWRYQILAAVLTYLSVVGIYIPDVLDGARKASSAAHEKELTQRTERAKSNSRDAATPEDDTPRESSLPKPLRYVIGYAFVFAIAAALPVMAGTSNLFGLLIIGFGVWEAWRLNRRIFIEVTGPHALSAGA